MWLLTLSRNISATTWRLTSSRLTFLMAILLSVIYEERLSELPTKVRAKSKMKAKITATFTQGDNQKACRRFWRCLVAVVEAKVIMRTGRLVFITISSSGGVDRADKGCSSFYVFIIWFRQNFFSSWGCRIHRLLLCRGVRHPPTSVLDMTLNNLMVRFQQCWSFGECGVPLHCHRSHVHSGPKW